MTDIVSSTSFGPKRQAKNGLRRTGAIAESTTIAIMVQTHFFSRLFIIKQYAPIIIKLLC